MKSADPQPIPQACKTFQKYFLSPLLLAPRGTLEWKCDLCDYFEIDLQQPKPCLTSTVTQFTAYLVNLEASNDNYSEISVSSVHTCKLTDKDSSDCDSDRSRCAYLKCELESWQFAIAVIWSSANFIHVLLHLRNVKCNSQLLDNKVLIQRRITSNTKVSFTKIWPYKKNACNGHFYTPHSSQKLMEKLSFYCTALLTRKLLYDLKSLHSDVKFILTEGCLSTASSHHPISSWSDEKCVRKWRQQVLHCSDLVTPRQGLDQWKWHTMVEFNGL